MLLELRNSRFLEEDEKYVLYVIFRALVLRTIDCRVPRHSENRRNLLYSLEKFPEIIEKGI